jgi:hypothetical protein
MMLSPRRMKIIDPQYFIDKAEQCFRLARFVGEKALLDKVAVELDSLGHEFLRKAVELDTERERKVSRDAP